MVSFSYWLAKMPSKENKPMTAKQISEVIERAEWATKEHHQTASFFEGFLISELLRLCLDESERYHYKDLFDKFLNIDSDLRVNDLINDD